MIKPEKLKKGDKVAIVSLSSGMIGDKAFIHKYYLGKQRLEEEFGLEVVAMPNALKGSEFLLNHPEARADDLMQALKDDSIKGIICSIGGEDTYRLLPYIDFDIIRNNPKIFMGFSDSTINHLMFYKAGVTSFYGPCLMCNFAEYGKMFEYEKDAVKNLLFNSNDNYKIIPSQTWTPETIWWTEENINKEKTLYPDTKGYEVLQGNGIVSGKLLGGCLESLSSMLGYFKDEWFDGNSELGLNFKIMSDKYNLFPNKNEWKNKILFIETSECQPAPREYGDMLELLIKHGVISNINGILVGKPKEEKFYEEYKEILKNKVGTLRPNLPIFYNVNFGHATPINIIPYGIECELDCEAKTLTLTENCLENNKNTEKKL